MLTYAFDLLYAIYEEEGYEADKIPTLILQHNLTGIEIDDRAGALAAFALAMKAAAKLGRRRFLRMEAKPDIVVLQNVSFTSAEMQDVLAVVGRDLFTDDFRETLGQFGHAKNFGSLIVPKMRDPAETLRIVAARDLGSDLLLREVQERVVSGLRMAEALSPKYHVVVANPPYMGGKGMNPKLSEFAKEQYPDTKSDLFAMFMERSLLLAIKNGLMAMINMQAWMFLSSFEKLRGKLLSNSTLLSMAHLGERAFDTIGGSVVSTTAFVFTKTHMPRHKGDYVRLVDGSSESEKSAAISKAIKTRDCGWLYRASSVDFEQIPGTPIAYWMSKEVKAAFSKGEPLKKRGDTRQGMATSDNGRFLRSWWEVQHSSLCLDASSREDAKRSRGRWFPYNKGGGYRKWFGNVEHVVNWENDGAEIVDYAASLYGSPTRTIKSISEYFKPSISWSKISSGNLALRYYPSGFIFDVAGCCIFTSSSEYRLKLTGFMNSYTARLLLTAISPTLNFEVGHIASLPILDGLASAPTAPVQALIDLAKRDWDSDETSWGFSALPLLSPDHRAARLEATYARLRAHWQGITDEIRALEEENNRIFIDAYGLQDELTPEVPIEEITLTCNPAYRYGVKAAEGEREKRLLADTMTEFVSYAVGCMFGRYSLDASGLILANQGETLADYLARVPEPSFRPDEDNVIPMLDGDWFADDIVDRFRKFLRVTFGDVHFRENLAFIEAQIGDIRRYFTRSFYDDHVKRYKKRPIYWMFASPKGTFQALIYMHRYRPDTVSVLLNDYLREFIRKLEAERERLEKLSDDPAATQTQRTRALKDVATIAKQIAELEEWERDVIFPLAQAKIEIDLDDGVKRNYPLFGAALKPIKGLEAADE
jgi:type II restriction/modification system DNA methylase subunit YeeA